MTTPFLWSPEPRESSIDVSSYGSFPYNQLSPMNADESYRIPVPGQEDRKAISVEGIWQGLKIIRGKTDYSLLTRPPKKRTGPVEGHRFGNFTIDYLDARRLIFQPAYTYHVINHCLIRDSALWGDLEDKIKSPPLTFHDVGKNDDINDHSQPYAHSSLLVELLNLLYVSPLPPFNQQPFEYLPEQVAKTIRYRAGLEERQQNLLDDVILFGYLFSGDEVKSTFAERYVSFGEFELSRRMEKFCQMKKKER